MAGMDKDYIEFSIINHKVRNHLTPIIGFIEVVLSELDSEAPCTDKMRVDLQIALNSAKSLMRICDDKFKSSK